MTARRPPSPRFRAARRPALAAAFVLLLLPLAACTSTLRPATTSSEVQEDLREIKQRLVEIQRQGAMTRVQVEEMERRLAVLEQRAGIRTGTSAGGGGSAAEIPRAAPRRTSPSTSSRDMPPRDTRADREPPPIEAPSAGVEGRDIVLEEPNVAVAVPPPASRDEAPSPPAGGDAPAVMAAAPISAAAQAIYDRGYTLYHQGRYLDAEAAFQRFLQAHSDTDLADNAQYWIGEARYARGDVPGSLAAFREVVARYPEGNKVPDALLKAGQSLERLGDAESARRTYQELADSFPNSAATVRAEERLAELP